MAIEAAYMVPHPPMILPQIGHGREADIAATSDSYRKVAEEIARIKPETIIISSPHATMYADYFHISPGSGASGSFARFMARDVRFTETYDTELRDALIGLASEAHFPAGTLGERDASLDHGTMIPLWFVRQVYQDFRIIRIGLSGLPLEDHYRLGMMIQEAVRETGRRCVYIASGDLSHKLQETGPYGFVPEGPQYDSRIMDVCSRAAFGELLHFEESFLEKAAECGHRSFVMMAGALDGRAVTAKALSHEDITGVGYGICMFHPGEPDNSRHFLREKLNQLAGDKEKADSYVRLAWSAIDAYVREGHSIAVPKDLPKELLETRAGAFVSIHKQGRLRGCIGTILPTKRSLAEEIIGNAISAATRDPRFSPIEPQELEWLEINVDVMGEPEDIESEAELDIRKYGVIVSSGSHRGLLLPDLDGIESVEQQVDIARQKAGIPEGTKIHLQRFCVTRHL